MNNYFVVREICPACGGRDVRTLRQTPYTEPPLRDYLTSFYKPLGTGIDLRYLEGAMYILDECARCGLIYQREVPGDELMRKLYGEWLDSSILHDLERKERSVDFYMWVAAEIARVIAHLGKLPADVVFLDYGTGSGNWCLIAQGFGCDVYAAEFDKSRVRHAQKGGFDVVWAGDLGDQQYDFINAEQVFEHLPNPLETLGRLKCALKPGGIIRISVPGGDNVHQRISTWNWQALPDSSESLNDVAPLQHINCFNFDSLVAMAQQVGLQETEVPGELLMPKTVSGRLRAALRPYVNTVLRLRHERQRRKSTNLCFRLRSG